MSKIVKLKNGLTLKLDIRPFASGGEGALYKIIEPSSYNMFVAKIYSPDKRTKERENKTRFLAENPPHLQLNAGHHSVIWINQLIYENESFCGFTMPLAVGEKLELLCHTKLPTILNKDWDKFNFQNPRSIELRLKLCFNIAVAVFHIHKLKNYVLIDMKPENIIVQPNGLISIIDIDSLAVIKNKKTLFTAPVATPEYTPPEYYKGLRPDRDEVNDSWDRFSMAVIFYRLLCGIHPFTGSCKSQFETCVGLVDMIKNGLFPNGNNRSYFKIIPPPHDNFNRLSSAVQGLFKKCFDNGFSNPDLRPSADDWCRCLSPEQIVSVNRPLPSTKVIFPNYTFSKAISYNPSTKIEVPNVVYVNPQQPRGLRVLLNGILGKSEKQEFIELIIQKENTLKEKEKKFIQFEEELKQILRNYIKSQESILSVEKSRIAELKKRFDSEIETYDKIAKDLLIQETNEMKSALNAYSSSITQIDENVRHLYSTLLAMRFEVYETRKSSIQNEIDKVESLVDLEIKTLQNDPTKLSKFTIERAAIQNFGVNTKKSLAQAGIYSAADIIDISSDGCFKNRSGKWIKIIGIGWGKANDLLQWRKIIEAEENQIISKKVKQSFSNRFTELNIQLTELTSKFAIEIKPFKEEYEKERMKHEQLKIKAKENYDNTLNQTKIKYNKFHEELFSKAKNNLGRSNTSMFKPISNETEKYLNDNFALHISNFGKKIKEIHLFTNDFKNDISALSPLQNLLIVNS